jgi:hypothetical protein
MEIIEKKAQKTAETKEEKPKELEQSPQLITKITR